MPAQRKPSLLESQMIDTPSKGLLGSPEPQLVDFREGTTPLPKSNKKVDQFILDLSNVWRQRAGEGPRQWENNREGTPPARQGSGSSGMLPAQQQPQAQQKPKETTGVKPDELLYQEAISILPKGAPVPTFEEFKARQQSAQPDKKAPAIEFSSNLDPTKLLTDEADIQQLRSVNNTLKTYGLDTNTPVSQLPNNPAFKSALGLIYPDAGSVSVAELVQRVRDDFGDEFTMRDVFNVYAVAKQRSSD